MKSKSKCLVFSILAIGIVTIALIAPYITYYDPNKQDLMKALQPPSKEHFFGTDRYGRDMLVRVLVGARCSVFSTLLLVSLSSVFGTTIGMICGYFEGIVDNVIMKLSDVFLSIPGMVFAVAVAGVLGGGIANAVFALLLISWPKYARLARSQVLSEKRNTYVDAAILSGANTIQIIFIHILPNIFGMVVTTALLDIGTMMMELAGLSFLGLGAMPPTAEWGLMMCNGRSMIQTSPWVILAPGFAIFITVSIFNLLGDSYRDWMDVRYQEKGSTSK